MIFASFSSSTLTTLKMEHLEDVIARVEHLEARVTQLEKALQNERVSRSGSSLRTFFHDFNPGNHTERALVIGYYLEKFDDKDGFTVEDLRSGYIESKVPLPANLSDVVAKTGKKGWAMTIGEEDQRQVWQITAEGEKYVEQKIEDSA